MPGDGREEGLCSQHLSIYVVVAEIDVGECISAPLAIWVSSSVIDSIVALVCLLRYSIYQDSLPAMLEREYP